MSAKITLKDGMIYRVISKDLYKQHKADGWTDLRVGRRYGMSTNELCAWKKENFTEEEIKNLSLRKKNIKNLSAQKSFQKEYRQALAEIEELEAENKSLTEQLNSPSDKNLKLNEKIIEQDYQIENHKYRIRELLSHAEKIERENKLMKELIKLWI